MVSLDGVAARGLVNGRGPSLAMGGMKSELVPTKPSQTYHIDIYNEERANGQAGSFSLCSEVVVEYVLRWNSE